MNDSGVKLNSWGVELDDSDVVLHSTSDVMNDSPVGH